MSKQKDAVPVGSSSLVGRIAFSRGVTWSYWRNVTVQWHWPRWSFVDGDYYIMAPSVARILWAAPSRVGKNNVREYGFGLVVAGVGVAVIWEKIVEQNAPNFADQRAAGGARE